MARLTPDQAAEKHARNLTGSTQDIIAGINRVSTPPGQQAAAKKDKMLANLTAAVQSGKWAARVAAVPLEEWKRAALEKGVNRIGPGIAAARAKMTDFFGQLLPYQDTLKQKVDSMPDLTLEDGIQRMTTFVRGMANFKRR